MTNLVKVEHRVPGADQSVYIATPAHTIFANFHLSLLRNVLSLGKAGVGVTYAHLAGVPHVDDARNLLAADFLASRATDLLYWDADVAAEPGAALRLLSYGLDIIGGAYPYKGSPLKFTVKLPEATGHPTSMEVPREAMALPTGFLRIRRHVVERLAKEAAWLQWCGTRMPIIFERSDLEGERVGGDFNFCRKVSALGFRTYVDPSLLFTHAGVVDFAGRLSDHLRESEAAQ